MYYKQGPFGDGSTYLFLHQFWLNNKFGAEDQRALLSGRPVTEGGIYFFFLRIFPLAIHRNLPWLPNFSLLCILWLVMLYAGYIMGINRVEYLLLLTIILLASPEVFVNDAYRMQFFTIQPRYFGALLANLIYLIIVFESQLWNPESYLMVAGVFVVSCLLLDTSVFSRQIYLFMLFPASLTVGDVMFPLVLVTSLLVACLSGVFRAKLLAQLKYTSAYFKQRSDCFDYRRSMSKNKFVRLGSNIFKSIFMSTAKQLLDYVPSFFLVFLLHLENYSLDINLLALDVSLLLAVFFTLRVNAVLGEGWRYLTFSLHLSMPLVAVYVLNLYGFTDGMITYLILVALIPLIHLLFDREGPINPNSEVFGLLDRSELASDERVLYCVPYRLGTAAVAMEKAAKTTEEQCGNADSDFMSRYFAKWPGLLNTNSDWISEAKPNLVLADKVIFSEWVKLADGLFVSRMKKIGETENYMLFKYS